MRVHRLLMATQHPELLEKHLQELNMRLAPIARFLASPDSGWLTGETLFATGGVR